MNWKSIHPEKLPDFIIGGAMKSGTTTLHGILDSHPEVSFAHGEIGFFDIDSLLQHNDYHFYNKANDEWQSSLLMENGKDLWEWYYSKFDNVTNSKVLKAEDSTTYLASPEAAKRLAMQDKPIKLIFILRHPTARTISNYLHALKSGRAIYSLEDTLRFDPNSILRRSLYIEQLEEYYKYIPAERIKVVLFEDMLADKISFFQELCKFLEIDFNKFELSLLKGHYNKTKVPKYIGLQLYRNRIMQYKRDLRYASFLPMQVATKKQAIFHRVFDNIHGKINPQKEVYSFKVSESTELLLDSYFKIKLDGLDKLVGRPLLSKWFHD